MKVRLLNEMSYDPKFNIIEFVSDNEYREFIKSHGLIPEVDFEYRYPKDGNPRISITSSGNYKLGRNSSLDNIEEPKDYVVRKFISMNRYSYKSDKGYTTSVTRAKRYTCNDAEVVARSMNSKHKSNARYYPWTAEKVSG